MRPTRVERLGALAGALLLAVSCASTPRTSTSPPRVKDSASEKVAGQRAAAPHGVQLEQNDERWGIEAARERKRQQDAGDKTVDVTR